MICTRPRFSRLVSSARRPRRAHLLSRSMTSGQEAEYLQCSPMFGVSGFLRFCERHVIVQDRDTRSEVPFVLFPGQRRVMGPLVAGLWLILLKGRQLGLTTEVMEYVLWRVIYELRYTAAVISSQSLYAVEVVRCLRWSYDRLPAWMRPQITTDNLDLLRFEARGHETELLALVGSAKTARSLTADLIVVDEASRVDGLTEMLAAVIPALEVAGGQLIKLSTSAGPQGAFYETWKMAYGERGELLDERGIGPNNFMPIFLRWDERPGRDQAWYEQQCRRLGSEIFVKREFPNTPQEAFEFAAGRIYPAFSREHSVGDIEIPESAERYRAIDWSGGVSAHVVLWAAHIPQAKPALLVSPDCPETIRELLGYRWEEKKVDRPVKVDDHACDALRYLLTTFPLSGLVYIYKEVYTVTPFSDGWTPLSLAAQIHLESGWEKAPPDVKAEWVRGRNGHAFECTVADRTGEYAIRMFNAWDIPTVPQKRFKAPAVTDGQTDNTAEEVIDGIRHVSNFIDGTRELSKTAPIDRARASISAFLRDRQCGRLRVSMPLSRVQEYMEAKEALRAK